LRAGVALDVHRVPFPEPAELLICTGKRRRREVVTTPGRPGGDAEKGVLQPIARANRDRLRVINRVGAP
jgi:hypothetical protein